MFQLGKIGDMILLTAVFKAIKEKYPDASVSVLAGRRNHFILKNNPNIDKIYIYEKTPVKIIKLICRLRQQKYDYWIDAKDHYSSESKLFAKLSKAKTKVGFNKEDNKVFDIAVPTEQENTNLHFIERAFNALSCLDIKINSTEIPKPELFEVTDSIDYVSLFINTIKNDKIITLNLSASSEKRMWQIEKWQQLINSIEETGSVVISTAPEHRQLAEGLKKSNPKINIFQSRNYDDVISLIKKSTLLITPDTSLVHVATAFDTPVIVLIGGHEGNFNKFRPLSTHQNIIRANEDNDLIQSIDAEDVIGAYQNIRQVIT